LAIFIIGFKLGADALLISIPPEKLFEPESCTQRLFTSPVRTILPEPEMAPLKIKSELVLNPISMVTVPATTMLLEIVFEAPLEEDSNVDPSLR